MEKKEKERKKMKKEEQDLKMMKKISFFVKLFFGLTTPTPKQLGLILKRWKLAAVLGR